MGIVDFFEKALLAKEYIEDLGDLSPKKKCKICNDAEVKEGRSVCAECFIKIEDSY